MQTEIKSQAGNGMRWSQNENEKEGNSSGVQCLPSLHEVLDLVLSNKTNKQTKKHNTARNKINIKGRLEGREKRDLF